MLKLITQTLSNSGWRTAIDTNELILLKDKGKGTKNLHNSISILITAALPDHIGTGCGMEFKYFAQFFFTTNLIEK